MDLSSLFVLAAKTKAAQSNFYCCICFGEFFNFITDDVFPSLLLVLYLLTHFLISFVTSWCDTEFGWIRS
jgi:hypothetical protein